MAAVCGISKWCHTAAQLAEEPALGSTEVLVLTNNVSFIQGECPRTVIVQPFSPLVQSAARAWALAEKQRQRQREPTAARRERELLPPGAAMITLLKWTLIGETRVCKSNPNPRPRACLEA